MRNLLRSGITGEDDCFEHISQVTVGDDIDNASECPMKQGTVIILHKLPK